MVCHNQKGMWSLETLLHILKENKVVLVLGLETRSYVTETNFHHTYLTFYYHDFLSCSYSLMSRLQSSLLLMVC